LSIYKKLIINRNLLIPLFYKLIKITILSIIGMMKKNKTPINFFLTIDAEANFIDTIVLDMASYKKAVHNSCLEIANLANEHNIKVVFFIDYPEIEIFRKRQEDIDELLCSLDKNGHSIQLHIHPALINDEASPDISFYSLDRIKEMISEGCRIITDVVGKRPIAFRAGGYSVGDWPKIYTALMHEGIQIDSSTFSGAKNLHKAKFNFKNLENMKPYFPSSKSLRERSDNGLIEFPITTVVKCENSLEASLFRFDPTNNIILLKIYTNYLLSRYNDVYINMIYHSKQVYKKNNSISKSYKNLKLFLKFIRKKNFISPSLESITI